MTSFRRCTRKPRRLATWQTSAAFDPALSSEKADRSVAAYSAIDARLDPPQRRHHMTGSFFCRNVLPDAKNPPPAGEQSRGDPLVTLDIAVEFRRPVARVRSWRVAMNRAAVPEAPSRNTANFLRGKAMSARARTPSAAMRCCLRNRAPRRWSSERTRTSRAVSEHRLDRMMVLTA
jgi:hypothetical protein